MLLAIIFAPLAAPAAPAAPVAPVEPVAPVAPVGPVDASFQTPLWQERSFPTLFLAIAPFGVHPVFSTAYEATSRVPSSLASVAVPPMETLPVLLM